MAMRMGLMMRSARWFQTHSRLSIAARYLSSSSASVSSPFTPSAIVASDQQFAQQMERFKQQPPDPERLYPVVVSEYLEVPERMTWMDLIKLRESESFLRKLNPLLRWCFAHGVPNPVRLAPVQTNDDQIDDLDAQIQAEEEELEQQQEEQNRVVNLDDIAAEMDQSLLDEDEAEQQRAKSAQGQQRLGLDGSDDMFNAPTNSNADADVFGYHSDKPLNAQYADAMMLILRKIANMTAAPSFMCEIYLRQFFLARGKLEYFLEQHRLHARSREHGFGDHRLQLGNILLEYVQRGRASELPQVLDVCPALTVQQVNMLLDALSRWELSEILVDLYEHHERIAPLRGALDPVPVLRAYDGLGRRDDVYRVFNALDEPQKQAQQVEELMNNLSNKHQKRRNNARNRQQQRGHEFKCREQTLPAQERAERERRQQD